MNSLSIIIIASLMLIGCEKNVKSGGDLFENPMGVPQNQEVEEETHEGQYVARFWPLNSALNKFARGDAKIEIKEDMINIQMDIKNSSVLTNQKQFIFEGSRCPNETDDLNQDGYLDPVEVSRVVGNILIPLDDNIEDQFLGLDQFPTTNLFGNYKYEKSGNLNLLLDDLFSDDLDFEDEIVKGDKTTFKFHNRVILIQGLDSFTYIPGTINTRPGVSIQENLTVACAEIKKI